MTDVEDIISTFDLLGDWEERYAYLVEVGERLAPMPDEHKVEANRVKGCMSQVWVKAYSEPQDPDRIAFCGDCDTAIIKGVLALLVDLFSGKTVQEIAVVDPDDLFRRLGLHEHLSPSRHFGIYAIVELMKQQVAELALDTSQVA